ncbi:MAG: hypothetical protein M3Q30_09350 [Actinomycetota bacterium]|nr:hypothetical protein [Actinomycetota bacterium]
MPTTSGTLAGSLLDVVAKAGAEFAVLHRESEILDGAVTSDIDIAVGGDALSTVRALIEPADAIGLAPVLVHPYDIRSVTTFWATADAREGVQLDLTCDPRGLGRDGFRTTKMLAHAKAGTRWPVLDELDQALYLLRKRQMKRDAVRTADALWDVQSHFGVGAAADRAEVLFGRGAGASVQNLLRRGADARNRGVGAHLFRSIRRVVWRVAQPIGFWVDLEDAAARPSMGEAVAARFGRFLIGSVFVARAGGGLQNGAALSREFVLRRWRAQLLVTTGVNSTWPRPDCTAQATDRDLDAVSTVVVGAMRDRTVARIGDGRRE